MLQLHVISKSGYPDIFVNGFNPESFPELQWRHPAVTPGRRSHNVARLPIRITNPLADGVTYTGPMADDLEFFVKSPISPIPLLLNSVLVEVMNEADDVVRRAYCHVPWDNLIREGRAVIHPGDVLYPNANFCLFDKTELANSIPPDGAIFYIHLEFCPPRLNRHGENAPIFTPSANTNKVINARFGPMQIRHSGDVDIL